MIQIKPVSCRCLLIEQQWPFFVAGWDDHLICFRALCKQQSNNHRTEDFVSEVYFWSGNWTSKGLLSPRSQPQRATGRRTRFISTSLRVTFIALVWFLAQAAPALTWVTASRTRRWIDFNSLLIINYWRHLKNISERCVALRFFPTVVNWLCFFNISSFPVLFLALRQECAHQAHSAAKQSQVCDSWLYVPTVKKPPPILLQLAFFCK